MAKSQAVEPKYKNILQAAAFLGCSRPTVYRLIRIGQLHIKDIMGLPYLSVKELAAVKADREGNGHPEEKATASPGA